jgi:DNA-binding transcriptional ArsR family regulator
MSRATAPGRPDVIFRALGDRTRLAIVARLRAGEAAAGDIAAGFRMSRPAVSRHIRVLRAAKLVTERRDGRNRVYSLNPEPLAQVDAWLSTYRQFWRGQLQALKRQAESV